MTLQLQGELLLEVDAQVDECVRSSRHLEVQSTKIKLDHHLRRSVSNTQEETPPVELFRRLFFQSQFRLVHSMLAVRGH